MWPASLLLARVFSRILLRWAGGILSAGDDFWAPLRGCLTVEVPCREGPPRRRFLTPALFVDSVVVAVLVVGGDEIRSGDRGSETRFSSPLKLSF